MILFLFVKKIKVQKQLSVYYRIVIAKVTGILLVKQILMNLNKSIKSLLDHYYLLCLVEDLQANNSRLLQLNENKNQILSTVSHELKTPMSAILGFSELLLSRDFSNKNKESYLQEIYSASKKLSHLIDDFLDLSRLESDEEVFFRRF